MSSKQAALASRSPTNFPSPDRQGIYFASGCLGGLATVPVELAWTSLSTSKAPALATFLRSNVPLIYRAGVRFWTFDHVKTQLSARTSLPISVQGGLGGAAGGLAEVCVHSLLQAQVPQVQALGSQGLKLFFCFGTYTFLSTSLAHELPPKPFWHCWLMGATAGGVGSGIVAAIQGARGSALWKGAVPRGALTIGTVISVHVTSCAALLKMRRI